MKGKWWKGSLDVLILLEFNLKYYIPKVLEFLYHVVWFLIFKNLCFLKSILGLLQVITKESLLTAQVKSHFLLLLWVIWLYPCSWCWYYELVCIHIEGWFAESNGLAIIKRTSCKDIAHTSPVGCGEVICCSGREGEIMLICRSRCSCDRASDYPITTIFIDINVWNLHGSCI